MIAMSMTEFLAAPYWNKTTIDPDQLIPVVKGGYTSVAQLTREFDLIGTYKFKLATVFLYQGKTAKWMIRGYIDAPDYDMAGDKEYKYVVFSLICYKQHDLPFNALHVKKVKVAEEYQGYGIAMYAYMSLVKLGYVVVSDNAHYDGGHYLWKKLAEKAHLGNYKVMIYNTRTKEFMTDEQGNVIKYDGHNIDESMIWSTGNDMSGLNIVLTLHDI